MIDLCLSQAVVAFNPFSALWEGIKQILGWIMNVIYIFLNNVFGINGIIAWCIILFTVIIYTLLIPLTLKQQRSMKLNSVVQPEINAITKKYKNKKDQQSQMQQSEEMMAVYKKYGTSPTGGCLVSFIQFPIMLALYRVLYNIPKYVSGIKGIYHNLISELMKTDYVDAMTEIAASKRLSFNIEGLSNSEISTKISEVLYQFKNADWASLTDKFPDLGKVIADTHENMNKANSFIFGLLDIAESPSSFVSEGVKSGKWHIVVLAILIPVLAGFFSWLSTKIISNPAAQPDSNDDNTMVSSLKMMNTIMPLFSAFICFSLPIGIGIYWIVSSVYRVISQYFIGKRMEKIDVNDIVQKNLEKYNKKRAKQGLPPQKIKPVAVPSVKETQEEQKQEKEKKEKLEQSIKKSTEYYNSSSAKPGSLKAKANMVQQYNEKHKK